MTFLQYLAQRQSMLVPEFVTHVQIVATSIAVAAALGLVLGVLAARSPHFAVFSIALTSAILTIPSFALFGILTIWLGIGDLPVKIGLILYALLPILRNTQAGILAVDPAIVEAARGMGMTAREVLFRVELPLALPLIVAGLRQSTVLVVAIATVGAAVGSNDLGQPILEGIRGSDRYAILSGVLPVAALGLFADAALAGIERVLGQGRSAGVAS